MMDDVCGHAKKKKICQLSNDAKTHTPLPKNKIK
jgi:hypothetical protein